MRLADLQRLFFGMLADGSVSPPLLSAELIGRETFPAAERAELYRNMYLWRLLDALREDFPKVAAAMGDDAFNDLAAAYIRECPSQHPSIAKVGQRLAALLSGRRAALPRPDLGDLAALEWARSEVFDDPPSPVADREDLAAVDPADIPVVSLAIVPAFRLLDLGYDVTDLWKRLDQGHRPEDPIERQTRVIVWRKEFSVFHVIVERDEADALVRARAGGTLAEVCASFAEAAAPEQRALEVVASWFAEGMIARVVA